MPDDAMAFSMAEVHGRELCMWLVHILRNKDIGRELNLGPGPLEWDLCPVADATFVRNANDLAGFLERLSDVLHHVAMSLTPPPPTQKKRR